ncbi:MAG TPA: isochorismatase family protein [Acidimicrobiales bacterium]|jgi:nicotinamidase-related amidase|nr:isochorismatase family protein [Acidimicrobiales bacterium]
MPRDLHDLVDPGHTVLLLQECQKGVVGDLSALPELALAAQAEMVPNVARLAAAARTAGARVIHLTAAHQPDMWGANTNARLFSGVKKSPVKLVQGVEAVEVLDEIGVVGNDIVLARQHGLSPFEGTELDSLLRNERIRTVVLVGVSVNVAILNVTFDAVNRAYEVVIPRDAVAGTPTEYVQQVFAYTLGLIATLTTTDDLVAAWSTGTP